MQPKKRKKKKEKARTACVPSQLTSNVKEGFFEVVVTLGRDIVVLEVLLAVELDILGLDSPVFAVNFVTAQHNGDLCFAHPYNILVPVRNALVCDTTCDVEHDDGGLDRCRVEKKVSRV